MQSLQGKVALITGAKSGLGTARTPGVPAAGGQSVADTDDTTLEKMLDVNFRAAFYAARAAIPVMRAQRSGRILVVASRQGVEPGTMVGAYSASKAAVVSLVKTIALENKDA